MTSEVEGLIGHEGHRGHKGREDHDEGHQKDCGLPEITLSLWMILNDQNSGIEFLGS